MTSDKKPSAINIGILALLLPLIVLAGVTGDAVAKRNTGGKIWQVKIAGYDPRDLLYGHYLTYRMAWDIRENASFPYNSYPYGEQTCLCLNSSGSGGRDPVATPLSCGMEKTMQCESVIRVNRSGGSVYSLNMKDAAQRHFIPEENARHVERLLRTDGHTLRVEFMARSDRSAHIRDLYVDDQPLETYLRTMPSDIQN